MIAARETALAARWRANRLEIIFVDHYAEIAQALAEIALAKQQGAGHEPLPARLASWRATVGHELLLEDDAASFPAAQDLLHTALRDALDTARATAAAQGADAGDEVLAATLWLVDATGSTLTCWATTDRIHRDLETIELVAIEEHSRWVAVRSFTRGAALGEPRDVYASRWRYIRGLPLTAGTELPVGVITVSSMLGAEETVLNRMSSAVAAAFDDALRQAALDILESVFGAA